MEKYKVIERSIIKKYRKTIWAPFVRAIKDYKLIEDKDNIMVCISGGKDSFLLAKLMQEIKKHGKIDFELSFVVMNPGYSKNHLKQILDNAKTLNINLEVFESDIFKNLRLSSGLSCTSFNSEGLKNTLFILPKISPILKTCKPFT